VDFKKFPDPTSRLILALDPASGYLFNMHFLIELYLFSLEVLVSRWSVKKSDNLTKILSYSAKLARRGTDDYFHNNR
jgi:hypothetical protein